MDGYLTAQQAADEIGITYSNLIKQISKGRIAVERHGWALFIKTTEVTRYKQYRADKGMTVNDASRSLEGSTR